MLKYTWIFLVLMFVGVMFMLYFGIKGFGLIGDYSVFLDNTRNWGISFGFWMGMFVSWVIMLIKEMGETKKEIG